MLETVVKIIARNPPSIAIAIAGLLTLAGHSSEAAIFLIAGILLQGLWILRKYSRS
jgi:Na+/phosphate symporter